MIQRCLAIRTRSLRLVCGGCHGEGVGADVPGRSTAWPAEDGFPASKPSSRIEPPPHTGVGVRSSPLETANRSRSRHRPERLRGAHPSTPLAESAPRRSAVSFASRSAPALRSGVVVSCLSSRFPAGKADRQSEGQLSRSPPKGPSSSSSVGPLGPRALGLAPGRRGRPQGVCVGGLTPRGTIPQNKCTTKCSAITQQC